MENAFLSVVFLLGAGLAFFIVFLVLVYLTLEYKEKAKITIPIALVVSLFILFSFLINKDILSSPETKELNSTSKIQTSSQSSLK